MDLSLVSNEQGVTKVQLEGQITQRELIVASDPMKSILGLDGYGQRVVVDLGKAGFVDSSGVGWLLKCHKRFREAGGIMVLHSLPSLVANVLKVLKLGTVLHLAEDETAALRLAAGDSE